MRQVRVFLENALLPGMQAAQVLKNMVFGAYLSLMNHCGNIVCGVGNLVGCS
jgi:hypothetical protein